jgi:hypothetical protein
MRSPGGATGMFNEGERRIVLFALASVLLVYVFGAKNSEPIWDVREIIPIQCTKRKAFAGKPEVHTTQQNNKTTFIASFFSACEKTRNTIMILSASFVSGPTNIQ